jgi:hypothetical protein
MLTANVKCLFHLSTRNQELLLLQKTKKLLSNPPWSLETKSSFQNLHPNVCKELATSSELADSKPAADELGSMGFMVWGPSRGRIVGVPWRCHWRWRMTGVGWRWRRSGGRYGEVFFWMTALTMAFFLDEILSSPTQNLPAQNLLPASWGPWVLWFGARRG